MKRALRTKVLLVDDSRIVRERLLALISELPEVEVIGQATNVAEAIKKIRRLRPRIVVLDISMPDGNGIQVLEAIRKLRRPHTHIIMLTNFAHEAYRERCLELGAQYFFDKSAEFEEAVGTIKDLSHSRSLPRLAAT
jgi:DNA-binding NarL/FixJ family response regulator